MITIHTLREATKATQQKKEEKIRAEANKWVTETLFPKLLEEAKQGKSSATVIFPREINAIILRTLLKDMGFSCKCSLDYDDSEYEYFQAVVGWL